VEGFEANNKDVAIQVWGMYEEDAGSDHIEVVRLSKARDRPSCTLYFKTLRKTC